MSQQLVGLGHVLELLHTLRSSCDLAEEIADGLPEVVRDYSKRREAGATLIEYATVLALKTPDTRIELSCHLRQLEEIVTALMDERAEQLGTTIGKREMSILISGRTNLRSLGSRSKREIERWHDAIATGDEGHLAFSAIPKNGKMQLEAHFSRSALAG